MNPSKAKGTSYENELLPELRRIFGPGVDRAKAGNESNDFHGVPIPVEAKHRKVWDLKTWVRKIRALTFRPGIQEDGLAGLPPHDYIDDRWAIFAADGDRRRAESIGDVMVVSRKFGMELLDAWWYRQTNGDTQWGQADAEDAA